MDCPAWYMPLFSLPPIHHHPSSLAQELDDTYQDAASNVLLALCWHSWPAVATHLETELLTGVFPHRSLLYVMGILSSQGMCCHRTDQGLGKERGHEGPLGPPPPMAMGAALRGLSHKPSAAPAILGMSTPLSDRVMLLFAYTL